MRKIVAWCGGLVLAGVLAGCGPAAPARTAGGLWGRVIEVPGLSALVTGRSGGAEVSSVSCGSAGNCAAGGYYWDRGQQGFAVAERNGRWGTTIPVPGLADLNGWRYADVMSVSCAPAGGCAAGGYYGDLSGHQQGFTVAERNGRWGTAIPVPGLAALNKRGNAQVSSVSCATPGNCAAGGYYQGSDGLRAFAAVERNGRWGTAIPVPGLAALNKDGGQAQVLTISCAPAGSCAAGGFYTGRHHRAQGS